MDLVSMEISGVRFSISCRSGVILREPEPSYQSFVTLPDEDSTPADVDIRLDFESMPSTEGFEKIFDGNQSWLMFRDGREYFMSLAPPVCNGQPFWVAQFHGDCTRVTVHCGEQLLDKRKDITAVSNPIRYPLDQVLLTYFLARKGGAIFHAAGVDVRGRGYIFLGKSGAGKSTIARHFAAKKHPVLLSDDRVVVRKLDGAFEAFGTPWPGDAGIALNRNVPLSGIFFIHHGSANRIKEVPLQEALGKLLPVTSIPWYDREIIPTMLSFCGDLVSHVPTYELHFKPSVEVVDVFEDFVAA